VPSLINIYRSENNVVFIIPVLIGSLTAGVVQVKVLDSSGGAISTNTVPFEYTDTKDKLREERERRRKRKNYLDGELSSSEDCLEMMSLVMEKLGDFQLNSNGGTSCNGMYALGDKSAKCSLHKSPI